MREWQKQWDQQWQYLKKGGDGGIYNIYKIDNASICESQMTYAKIVVDWLLHKQW